MSLARQSLPLRNAAAVALVVAAATLSGCTEPVEPADEGCRSNRDCPANYVCRSGECEPRPGCTTDFDCPSDQVCSAITRECVVSNAPGDGGDGGEGDGGDGDGGDEEDDGGTQNSCHIGNRYCDDGNALVCNDGVDYEEVDCEGRGCSDGHCRICEPGEASCDLERNLLVECSGDGTLLVETPCTNGSCDPSRNACVFYACEADELFCNGTEIQRCREDRMSWEPVADCADDGLVCEAGNCVSECEKARLSNSYIGCEYWPMVMANQVDSLFHDQYAVVVSNPHPTGTAEVSVFQAGGATPIATEQVAPGAVKTIHLPWNAMGAREVISSSRTETRTRRGNIAYRLESTLPVTAYQFNPLATAKGGTYSYSNDASLLLPTHIYAPPGDGSTYFVVSMAHQDRYISDVFSGSTTADWGALVAVVGTEDGTEVTVRSRGGIASGGGIAGVDPGGTVTFTLNRHEVVQLASRPYGNPDRATIVGDIFTTVYQREYRQSDMTGSVITADKPVAVYTGADCYYMPFTVQACDHMEEQLFPYQNLGSSYVAARTALPPLRQGQSPVDPGDIWRIVAAVDGTQLTFQPQVHANVSLNAGQWIQVQTNQNFIVSSQNIDHPIAVTQFMVGQQATNSTMGDPSMILAVPRLQYRDSYSFTTPTTIAKNYINVVRPLGAEVLLNDSPVTATWTQLSDVEIAQIEIPGGTHTITSNAKIGVTVYGYDETVSYGYPAGMDLTRNVSVTLP